MGSSHLASNSPFAHGMTSLLAHLVTLGASAASHGWHAARAAAGLPATCRQAAAHAALVCSGMDPVYFSAGFAPLSLAWGRTPDAEAAHSSGTRLASGTGRVGFEPNWEGSECMCRLLLCMLLCLQSLQPAPPAAICFLAPSRSPTAPAMAAASRCDVCGLGLWSPATRCAGCTAQARLNHAVAHRIWPAATWRAVGMALSAILAMADAQVDTGDGAGERDRARSRRR